MNIDEDVLMVVKINFYGPLARWAGKSSFQSSLQTQITTIRQVFETLDKQIGKSVLDHLLNQESGNLKAHFHVLLNGKDVELMNGLDEQVKDGDTVTVVPPVGGG